MNTFDENKHPRDDSGRFTDKSNNKSNTGEAKRIFELAERLGVEYNQDTSYQALKARVEQAEKNEQKSASLSKQEWAQYYKILGDEQHGDFVYKTKYGQRVVRLGNKIVFDNGSFKNPRVKRVVVFENNDEMNYWLNVMVKKEIIK